MKTTNSANVRVTTAALLVSTQCYENYGFDAEGKLDPDRPYWKAKGGSDILITGVDQDSTEQDIRYVVDAVRERIECDNDFFREYILGWKMVEETFQFGDWQDEYLMRIPNPKA